MRSVVISEAAEQHHVAAAADVLVIGEALVDIVVSPDGARAEAPGGSPMNVAVALARLGVQAQLATSLAHDRYGELIKAHLRRSGVRLTQGSDTLPTTSTALARLQPDGSARYEFDIAWAPRLPEPSTAAVVHAGSLGLWLDPGAEAVHRCLREAAVAGAVITLDPNIRPAMLPGSEIIQERFEELAASAHVVKLSAEDAAYLYSELDATRIVERLTHAGVRLVVITDESRGTVIASGRNSVIVDPPLVTVSDTIGAGDTFMGALIHQLLTRGLVHAVKGAADLARHDLEAICLFANRAAAITVSRQGADPPWFHELHSEPTVVLT